MLYLIKSGNYLKIGFTDCIGKRLSLYLTHTLDIQLLGLVLGTKEDETNLHDLCNKYKIRTEWFYPIKEVIDIWKQYTNNKTPIRNIIDKIIECNNYNSYNNKFKYLLGLSLVDKEIKLDENDLVGYLILNMENADLENYPSYYTLFNCKEEELKPDSNKGLHWIKETLQNLNKNEFSYTELEEVFTPLFKEHSLKWNNKSIKQFFPNFTKKRKQINGIQTTYYKFNLCYT